MVVADRCLVGHGYAAENFERLMYSARLRSQSNYEFHAVLEAGTVRGSPRHNLESDQTRSDAYLGSTLHAGRKGEFASNGQ